MMLTSRVQWLQWKHMPKKMTLDRLAAITQREFRVVHGDVSNLRGEVNNLRRDMEGGFRVVAGTLELIRQDFAEMKRSFSLSPTP